MEKLVWSVARAKCSSADAKINHFDGHLNMCDDLSIE
jgi:hypothetical protein